MWPELLTYYSNVKIIQKSDRWYLDLTFSKMSSHINIFNKCIVKYLNKNMTIEKTGKSMAIRMLFPLKRANSLYFVENKGQNAYWFILGTKLGT